MSDCIQVVSDDVEAETEVVQTDPECEGEGILVRRGSVTLHTRVSLARMFQVDMFEGPS